MPRKPDRAQPVINGGANQKIDFIDQHHPSLGYASAVPSSTEEGNYNPRRPPLVEEGKRSWRVTTIAANLLRLVGPRELDHHRLSLRYSFVRFSCLLHVLHCELRLEPGATLVWQH